MAKNYVMRASAPANQQYAQKVKKSGASYSTIQNPNAKYLGYRIVNAWNVSKSKGLITAVVSPYDKSTTTVTNNKNDGTKYVKMLATVEYKNSGVKRVIPCLMNIETEVIVLSEIGMCITPNGQGVTASGKKVKGYFGTMFTK